MGLWMPGAAVAAPTLCCALSAALLGCGAESAQRQVAASSSAGRVSSAVAPDPATARAARGACGSTPRRVVKAYLPGARTRGADQALLRLAADPPKRVTRGPGYALLAGAVYASSLPVRQRVGVAPVCAKELMSKKSMSNEGTSR